MATSTAKVERNIIIAVDESPFSEYAFDFYVRNVHRKGDHITLVHCSEYSSIVQAPAVMTDPLVVSKLIKEEEKKVCDIIAKYSDKMKAAHIGGRVRQTTGRVGEAIIEASKAENASMIIMGTRGMGKLRRTFIGSVSDYCLHHAHVPVLVCRNKQLHGTDHHHHHEHKQHTKE